jgi:cytochrome c-type biogenesis protein
MTTLALAFLSGVLSILSPCVLPLVPIVLGAAISEHRFGPLALALGLALSFTGIGLLVALVGFSAGFDASTLRTGAAVIMVALGLVLMLPAFQVRLAAAGGPVANWAEQSFGGFSTTGLGGQFAVGLLLGAVWSPCVGPTLGAASLLASQGRDLGQVALTMAAFGFGAGLPLALFGFASRAWLTRMRDRMLAAGKHGKLALGLLLIVLGLAIATGIDKRIETVLVEASPAWLTDLTTRF